MVPVFLRSHMPIAHVVPHLRRAVRRGRIRDHHARRARINEAQRTKAAVPHRIRRRDAIAFGAATLGPIWAERGVGG